MLQGVPHLHSYHYQGSHYRNLWLMYVQVGAFGVSRGPPTIPSTQILLNMFVFSSPKICVRQGPSVLKKVGNNSVSSPKHCHSTRLLVSQIQTEDFRDKNNLSTLAYQIIINWQPNAHIIISSLSLILMDDTRQNQQLTHNS